MLASSSSVALFAALSLIEVRGGTLCPAPSEVNVELARILAVPETAQIAEHVMVTREERSLVIVLVGADGQRLGERELPAEGSCEAQARAVAVVVGAWLSDAHPEYVRALPGATALPAPEPRGPAEAPPQTPAPAPADPPSAVLLPRSVHVEAARRPVANSSRREIAFGAGIGASATTPRVAVAGLLSASWMPRAGLGAASFVALVPLREQPLGSGRVEWFRWPIALGAAWRSPSGPASVDLGLGAVAAWLHVEGRSFEATNSLENDVSFGSFANVRLAAAAGVLRPFAAATGLFWLRGATVQSEVPRAELELPRLEVLLTAGLELAL